MDTLKSNGSLNSGNIATHGTIVVINCILNAPLMLIAIFGNGLVLAAIIRTPSIRSPSMIMLCSLAFSDFLVGFITQPLYIVKELTENRPLDILWDTMAYSFCGVSLLIITAINVDRVLALHYHMLYPTIVTKSRVKSTMVILWCINFLSSTFYFMNDYVYHFVIAVMTGICLVISTISYIRIYTIVRRHHFQIHVQHQAVQCSNAENDINILRMKKSAINTFIFYIILVMCFLPLYIFLTLHGLSHKPWPTKWNFATTLVFANSSINPFLYCWRLRELRKAVVKTARKVLCKENEQE